jgi:hypothetical protein
MAKKPEPPKATSWNICKIASKAVCADKLCAREAAKEIQATSRQADGGAEVAHRVANARLPGSQKEGAKP